MSTGTATAYSCIPGRDNGYGAVSIPLTSQPLFLVSFGLTPKFFNFSPVSGMMSVLALSTRPSNPSLRWAVAFLPCRCSNQFVSYDACNVLIEYIPWLTQPLEPLHFGMMLKKLLFFSSCILIPISLSSVLNFSINFMRRIQMQMDLSVPLFSFCRHASQKMKLIAMYPIWRYVYMLSQARVIMCCIPRVDKPVCCISIEGELQ